jgi:hypothetical protein
MLLFFPSDEQNMIAYQMGTSIYYSTIRDIVMGEELRVWYAAPYARKIGKSVTPDGISRGKYVCSSYWCINPLFSTKTLKV